VKRLLETYARLQAGERDNGARRLVQDFEAWFGSRDGTAPFFAFFNFMEPHAPYLPPREFVRLSGRSRIRAGRLVSLLKDSADLMVPYNLGMRDLDPPDVSILRHLYEGELSYVDRTVGRLIERLKASGDLDHTVVAVTADHGENVGEHHLLAHNMSLHETVLHVPLVLRGPGVPQGRREETVSTLGLHAALLEAVTGSPQPRSLVSDPTAGARSEYESARHQVRALGRLLGDSQPQGDGVPALAFSKGAAVYRGSHKAVASAGKVDVFDLASDPGEQAPVPAPWTGDARLASEEAAAAVEELQGAARPGPTSALDEEIRSHLEALGYL
jgi:arylsulfatase A-like enzyme